MAARFKLHLSIILISAFALIAAPAAAAFSPVSDAVAGPGGICAPLVDGYVCVGDYSWCEGVVIGYGTIERTPDCIGNGGTSAPAATPALAVDPSMLAQGIPALGPPGVCAPIVPEWSWVCFGSYATCDGFVVGYRTKETHTTCIGESQRLSVAPDAIEVLPPDGVCVALLPAGPTYACFGSYTWCSGIVIGWRDLDDHRRCFGSESSSDLVAPASISPATTGIEPGGAVVDGVCVALLPAGPSYVCFGSYTWCSGVVLAWQDLEEHRHCYGSAAALTPLSVDFAAPVDGASGPGICVPGVAIEVCAGVYYNCNGILIGYNWINRAPECIGSEGSSLAVGAPVLEGEALAIVGPGVCVPGVAVDVCMGVYEDCNGVRIGYNWIRKTADCVGSEG